MRPRFSSLLVLVALSSPGVSLGSPATDELLRYVPEDVGFCVVVQDLRGHFANLQASPFYLKWGKSFLGSARGPERKQLEAFEKYAEKHLGVTSKDLVEDIFGDAFVFAFRPGPAGKPGEDQGLFMIRARDAKKLARLVERLNKLQKSTGELEELTDKEHRGVRYVARKEAKETTYYLLRGPVLLVTSQRPLLERAIDCDLDLAEKAQSPLARRLEQLHLDKALIALALNPRAWDSAITAKTSDEGKAVAGYWKAVEGVGLGLSLDADIRLSLTIKAKVDRLGPAAQRFLATASKPSPLWSSFPENALFAASGRLDAPALYEMMSEFLTKASRKALEEDLERTLGAVLGKGVVKELLPALGPDWGVCVTAPPADGKQWVPNVVAAVRIARGDEDDPIDQAVLSGVHTLAQLAILAHNKQHPGKPMALKTTTRDKVRLRHLTGEGVFPPGLEPACALKAGYLVVTSSPAGVAAFEPGLATPSADVPLLRASLEKWRAYLAERREPIAAALVQGESLSKAKALERLDAIRAGLEVIDRLELRHSAKGEVAAFTLTLTPAAALKK
jgi:Protein of unknown function (DUF3352)